MKLNETQHSSKNEEKTIFTSKIEVEKDNIDSLASVDDYKVNLWIILAFKKGAYSGGRGN